MEFDLAQWCSNVLKSQCRYKLQLAKYSNCSIQLNHSTTVITGLYYRLTVMTLGVHSPWKVTICWIQLKTLGLFKVLCLVIILSVGLSCIYTALTQTPPMLLWLTQECILRSWLTQGWTFAQLADLLSRCSLSLIYAEKSSALFAVLMASPLLVFMTTSPLSIALEPSSL